MPQPNTTHKVLTNNDSGPRNPANCVFIVLHTTESSEQATSRDVARYQQNPSAGGSYNVLTDKLGESTRSNDDNYVPWSTGSTQGNTRGLNIAMCSSASWSTERWLSEKKLLDETARIVAEWCKLYNIPARKLNDNQARNLERGIIDHWTCTRVFGGSDHTDVGRNFPWDHFIKLVAAKLNGTAPNKPSEGGNTMSDKVEFELTYRFPSRVQGSTYKDTAVGYILNIDAATYRTEKKIDSLIKKVDELKAALEKKAA